VWGFHPMLPLAGHKILYCVVFSFFNKCFALFLQAFLYQRCITYSCILSPEELADVIIEEIVPAVCAQPQGVPVNYICRRLGHLIFNRFASKYKDDSGVADKVALLIYVIMIKYFYVLIIRKSTTPFVFG